MWNIYEQPWTLLITAAVLLLLVAAIIPFLHAKHKRRLWLIPLVVALLALLLDFAVATDREKIQKVINTAVKAIENEDCDAIAAILSPDYKDSVHTNKAALLRRCRAILRPPLADKVYDSILDMNISGNTAALTILNRIFFDAKSQYAEFAKVALVKLSIDLKKTPDGNWLVTGTEILAINNQPAQWSSASYIDW